MITASTPPKVSYGPGPTVLTLTYPAKPWDMKRPSIGGIDWSATGVPAAYKVRSDGDLIVPLRVTEAELASVFTWLDSVQDASSFLFWLDSTGSSVSVYLVSPAAGEEIAPQRDGEFPMLFVLPVTLRRTDGAAWTEAYFG